MLQRDLDYRFLFCYWSHLRCHTPRTSTWHCRHERCSNSALTRLVTCMYFDCIETKIYSSLSKTGFSKVSSLSKAGFCHVSASRPWVSSRRSSFEWSLTKATKAFFCSFFRHAASPTEAFGWRGRCIARCSAVLFCCALRVFFARYLHSTQLRVDAQEKCRGGFRRACCPVRNESRR